MKQLLLNLLQKILTMALKQPRRPSGEAVALIKRWEGCKLTSYQDVGGVWTVGYGTTGPNIGPGVTITQVEADYLLTNRLNACGEGINRLTSADLTQRQFDALCCLVYNIGLGAFERSTLLSYLNTNQIPEARAEILKWDHVHGVEVKGLYARRLDEWRLFQG